METIESIHEAYSMQPASFYVVTKNIQPTSLVEIRREVDGHTDKSAYIGYTINGEKLFMYFADSVNVHYKTKEI